MNDDKKKGLGAARDFWPILLEDKIRVSLLSIPKEESLKDQYPIEEDRTKIYRRLILEKVIDEVYKTMLTKIDDNSEIIEIEIPDEFDPWYQISSQFSAARRDFIHDKGLLNVGRNAELILSPIDQDLTPEDNFLTNDQKLMMMSLFVIRNRPKGVGLGKRIELVGKLTKIPRGTLKLMNTKLPHCLNKFKKQPIEMKPFTISQLNYWFDLEAIANPSGKSSPSKIPTGNLLLPILRGFAEASPYKGRKR